MHVSTAKVINLQGADAPIPWDELYRLAAREARRACGRSVAADDVEDISHGAIASLWLRDGVSSGSWWPNDAGKYVRGIVYRARAMTVRQNHGHQHPSTWDFDSCLGVVSTLGGEISFGCAHPPDAALELRGDVDHLRRHLTKRDYLLLLAKYVDEKPNSALMESFGIASEPACRQALKRARARARALLQDEWESRIPDDATKQTLKTPHHVGAPRSP